MNIFRLTPDFSVLVMADSLPLPSGVEIPSPVTSARGEPSSPSGYLHQDESIVADTSSQRRIDEFSITPAPPLQPPKPTPQSEETHDSPTDSKSLNDEDIESDSEVYFTPLDLAEANVYVAIRDNAPKKIINSLRDKVRYERVMIKKKSVVRELEANLPPEQIASIRTESQKSAPSREEKYDRVMRYLKSHPDDPMTQKYTPEGICDAIVDNKKGAFKGTEREQFRIFRKKVISGYSSFKSRRIAKAYVRLLKEANAIAADLHLAHGLDQLSQRS